MYKPYSPEKIREFENEISTFFKRNEITLIPNMDLTATCIGLGFSMFSMELPKDIDGIILANKFVKKIGISNKLGLKDARRVIAHELSHYIHHLSEVGDSSKLVVALKDNILHDNKKTDLENQMDYMAAAILVPMDSFIEELRGLGIKGITKIEQVRDQVEKIKINYLATLYEVDADLIERRIVEACTYVG